MTEQQLREFRIWAEELVELPDFGELDRRGRKLRRRRQAITAGVAACLLVVGAIITAQNVKPKAQEPVEPPELPAKVAAYPGNHMTTLEEGTYELTPGSVDGGPVARVIVPSGWNAWEGPNHFNGHAPGRSNEEALGHATWYAGLLVLQVRLVAAGPCDSVAHTVDVSEQGTSAVVRAIRHVPWLEPTAPPERLTKFGHPAVHLNLEVAQAKRCSSDVLFDTVGNGPITGFREDGSYIEAWVVDVEGHTTVIWGNWTPNTPPNEVRDLRAMIDSIEFDLEE
jgi:hypothetical protein